MTYQLTTMENGLRVASESLPGVESVAVAISVGVGARYESAQENGISHLLEHMAFKGTKTRTARDIAEAFDAVGGQINAYTSMEATVYHAKVLKGDLEVAVNILGDIIQNSIFDPEELAREENVVLQEIAMYRDTPEDVVSLQFDAVTFPNQPLGRSILGTEEAIGAYTRDDVITYMAKHYKTPRIVLSAAGNLKHETLVDLANRYFDLPKSAQGPSYEKAHYTGGDARSKSDHEQLHVLLGLPAASVHSPDYYALQLYANILGGGMSSRLFQEVREKRGLAYGVSASVSTYDDCGLLTLYAGTSPAKARDLSAVLCDELLSMAHAISDAEIARAKNQTKAELLMARENPQSVASWIGRHLLIFGEYRRARDIATKIDAVAKDDLMRVAKTLLQGKPTVAALGDVSGVLPYEELEKRLR